MAEKCTSYILANPVGCGKNKKEEKSDRVQLQESNSKKNISRVSLLVWLLPFIFQFLLSHTVRRLSSMLAQRSYEAARQEGNYGFFIIALEFSFASLAPLHWCTENSYNCFFFSLFIVGRSAEWTKEARKNPIYDMDADENENFFGRPHCGWPTKRFNDSNQRISFEHINKS